MQGLGKKETSRRLKAFVEGNRREKASQELENYLKFLK